jgi:hypothetical protein
VLVFSGSAFAGDRAAILAALDADGVVSQSLDNNELDALKGAAWYTNAALPTYTDGIRYINMKFNGGVWGSRSDYTQWSMVMKWDYPDRYRTYTYSDGRVVRMHGDWYQTNEPGNATLERHLTIVDQDNGNWIPRQGSNTIATFAKTWNRPLNYKYTWYVGGNPVPY